MPEPQSDIVTRRRVFYIPGYDPKPARRYRELYRTEGARQSEISGYELALRPKEGARYGWQVAAKIEGCAVETEFELLAWSDLVRSSMAGSIAKSYWLLARAAWTYIGSGAVWGLFGLRKGPVIAAFYPVLTMLTMLVVALGLGHLAGLAALWLLGLPGWALPAVLSWAIWGGVLCAVAVALLRAFRANDHRHYTYYLMHNYAFSSRYGGANPPELDARLRAFTQVIAAALSDDVDEVLVVGHSSGVHLGVTIMADLLRQTSLPAHGPRLSFLTVGQVVPMVSFLPKAEKLRADLHYMAAQSEVFWVDVTAPGDGCAFALCDPVAVSGVAPPEQRAPLVISAAFSKTLKPETWAALRYRFFRLHFQYLCAFDQPGEYDYFKITAGPQTLAARFEGRVSSGGRIDATASRFTSMAA